uniref:LNR domain-containing protein n=1 Tax=Syphacia muris TaxID=451379 RepID=A0A0N5AT12_9BILA
MEKVEKFANFYLLLNLSLNKLAHLATNNIRQIHFLTKDRGPQRRIQEPKIFDDFCNMDSWIIKERSGVSCNGTCFKWQQIVNNSGSYSYMTLRSCYNTMFDLSDPVTVQEPNVAYCSTRSTPLDCLADAEVLEDTCWCYGDYCNSSNSKAVSLITVLLVIIFSYTVFKARVP